MKDKKEKRSIKDFVPALLVSLAASFMIMVFAPIEIYYSNQDQFWFEIKQLIPVVICLFMIFLVVSLVVLGVLFLINQKAYNVGIILYLIAFLSTYIQGNFLVKNLPGLDGTQPVWKDYISEDIKTIIVWGVVSAIVIAFAVKFKSQKVRSAISIVSVCIFLMIAVTLVTVVLTTKVTDKDYEMVVTDKDEFEMSSDTNFIILLLDAMEGGTYDEVAQNHPEYAEIMRDFTYYDNTVCGYTFTKQSIPFILSGIWYENERPFVDYATDAYTNSPFLTKLSQKGYKMSLYEPELYTSDKELYKFSNIIKNKTDISSYITFMKREIQITGYKYAPFILKRFCMVGTQDFEDFRTNPDDCETFSYDNEVFYNAVKNSEMTKTDDKTFKFIHIWGAHVPFVFDKDMNRIEDGTYAQNVEACMTMTDAYLKKLKENGVYDNSVIIVMADHGYGLSYGPRNRQHPVLFIKGKNESHDYTVSEAPISYDDLQEAYSRLLDGATGEDVFDYKEGDERQRRYLYFEYEHEEILEEYFQEGYAGDLDTLKASGRKFIYEE